MATGAAWKSRDSHRKAIQQHHHSHLSDGDTPAPVDGRVDGLWTFDYAPMPPVDHPMHPLSDWNLYGRPEPAPWGSYMDTRPLPLPRNGRGPIAYAMDVVAQGVRA